MRFIFFFSLPDVLGIDSILDIPENHDNEGHILLHDSFDIKKVGTEITNIIIGAAIHAPFPTVGGFLKLPDETQFPTLIEKLETIRLQVLRGIAVFYHWDKTMIRNSDYMCLRNDKNFNFLEGVIINSTGRRIPDEEFHTFLKSVVIPY